MVINIAIWLYTSLYVYKHRCMFINIAIWYEPNSILLQTIAAIVSNQFPNSQYLTVYK